MKASLLTLRRFLKSDCISDGLKYKCLLILSLMKVQQMRAYIYKMLAKQKKKDFSGPVKPVL